MSKTDVLIPMARNTEYDWMQMIVERTKTYEFRKNRYPTSVLRIWFYQTAPISSLTYICEVDPGLARDPSNPLPLNGHDNREFNEGTQPDWSGTMHAYRVKSCYKIRIPIPLKELKEKYGFGGAPRGMVYVTKEMREDILWDKQELMWTEATETTYPISEKFLAQLLAEGAKDSAEECLKDRAMVMAQEEIFEETGRQFKPWCANGKSLRMGEIIVIIDSDTTFVPEDFFTDAAREMGDSESPDVAIIQRESDVMQEVAHRYFENGITHFTRCINKCISLGCANGEVAQGLRWT